MAFRESLRLEAIYFKNLRALITTLQSWKAGENPEKIRDILDSCIEANSAILLLYRNLGEMYNDLVSQIMEERKTLDALKTAVENYHNELNEKIDGVNNYIMALIRDLETRMDAVEAAIEHMDIYYNYYEIPQSDISYRTDRITVTNHKMTISESEYVIRFAWDLDCTTLVNIAYGNIFAELDDYASEIMKGKRDLNRNPQMLDYKSLKYFDMYHYQGSPHFFLRYLNSETIPANTALSLRFNATFAR